MLAARRTPKGLKEVLRAGPGFGLKNEMAPNPKVVCILGEFCIGDKLSAAL